MQDLTEDPVGLPEAIDTLARRIVAMDASPQEARAMWDAHLNTDDWRRILKRASEIRISVDCSDRAFNSSLRFLRGRSAAHSPKE